MLATFFATLGLTVAAPALPPLPVEIGLNPPPVAAAAAQPVVAAESALVVDLGSGQVLWEKNAYARRPIASLTKLMTAIVARENFALDEKVAVGASAAAVEPAKMWLLPGEEIRVGALLRGLLIASANDAALTLAAHFAGGEAAFVAAMNERAAVLGLTDTHFANPIGFDDPQNYSTAHDLALLASYFLRDDFLAAAAATAQTSVSDTTGRHVHSLKSTNELFGSYLAIAGLKTGTTDEAGACVAALARGPHGQQILAIVLHSPDRFQEAKGLLDWALTTHRW